MRFVRMKERGDNRQESSFKVGHILARNSTQHPALRHGKETRQNFSTPLIVTRKPGGDHSSLESHG